MASKLTKLMNKTSISSLKSAIQSPTQAAFVSKPCKSTSLFRQFSLRSPLELGRAQLILPLFRMSACMSTSSKSGKAPGKASSQGPSRNTGRVRAAPQNAKFPKQHKGRMKGISHQGNQISFGKYALQALEHSWISSRQIEAGRKAMIQYVRRDGKIWVRIFPDKPVTVRPTETRMGRGKGSCAYWVAVVQPGRILYEMGGVTERMARKAISTASSKMPIRTQFISL